MVKGGSAQTSEALRINGSTPNLTSCIAFCIVISASRELNLGRDILICTRNFVFRCSLAGEEEERVQTRMSRLGGCLASWGRTLRFFGREQPVALNPAKCRSLDVPSASQGKPRSSSVAYFLPDCATLKHRQANCAS